MTACLLDDTDTGEMSPSAAAVSEIAAAVDHLLAADLTLPSDTDILDLLRGVEVQSRRLHAASIAVIAQITDRGLAAPAGATSTAGLLRQVLPLSAGDAYQRVRLAAATSPSTGLSGSPIPPALPQLAAALHAGSVPARNAVTIVGTLNGFPADVPPEVRDSVEEFLVEQAAVLDPKTFSTVARRIALMADPDGPEPERDAADKQEFHIGRRRDDGLTRCWGLLDDLTIEALRAAFGAMCAPAADRNRKTGEPDTTPGDTEAPDSSDTESSASDSTTPDGDADPATHQEPGTAEQHDETTPPGGDEACPPEDIAAFPPDPGEITGESSCDIDIDIDIDMPPAPTAQPAPADPADQPAPRRPWRPTRPPHWAAPLGTLPGDYRPPDPHGQCHGQAHYQDQPPPPPVPPDGRSAGTRRAHALGAILTAFLNAGTAPTVHGEKPHLLVTISEADLRQRIGSAQLGYGDTIPIAAARMLACDAAVIPAVLRGTSEIVDVGRAMRTFTAAGRKAILLRDIGCVFPGCTMPGAWCDNHHIQHWADGGPSNLDNAALLCRRHHNLIHRGLWRIRLGADRRPEIIPPATHDPAQRPLRNTVHRPPTFNWPATDRASSR